MSEPTEMQLLHLHNCATTTKYGMVDRGFPAAYALLEAMGMTEKKGAGYVVTELGLATLKINNEKLFGKKKRAKKSKYKEYDNESDDYETII